jgi:hypothetical protein
MRRPTAIDSGADVDAPAAVTTSTTTAAAAASALVTATMGRRAGGGAHVAATTGALTIAVVTGATTTAGALATAAVTGVTTTTGTLTGAAAGALSLGNASAPAAVTMGRRAGRGALVASCSPPAAHGPYCMRIALRVPGPSCASDGSAGLTSVPPTCSARR